MLILDGFPRNIGGRALLVPRQSLVFIRNIRTRGQARQRK